MSDLIFIGPQAAGKTTLFKVLQGEEPPIEHNATQSHGRARRIRTSARMVFGGLFRGRVSIIDAGGMESEFNHYMEWCQNARKVIIVFNGLELLNETDKPEEGGTNSSFLKKILSELAILGVSNLYFVATFADKYVEEFCPENETMNDIEKGTFLQNTIIRKINQVNQEYNGICGAKRYPMYDRLVEGRFYGVNAKNSSSVINVFTEILNS